jgi:hypothetical protein
MKKIYLLLIGLLISCAAFSQVELAIKGGGAFYFGDISAYNMSSFMNAKETAGLNVRYNYKPYLSFNLGYNWAQVIGTDAYSGSSVNFRDLSVSTYINEITLMPEFNFINIKIGEEAKFTAYVGTGVSFFTYRPTTYYGKSRYVRLREIGTEGQGLPGYAEPYKNYSFAIPMNCGVKLAINDFFSIDWTILNNRYTFTDYLDDVSTVYPDLTELGAAKGQNAVYLSAKGKDKKKGDYRGNSGTNDWFGTMTVGFCFNLGAINMKKKEQPKEKQ